MQCEVVIKYVIEGLIDGRWIIQAFDYKGRPLGTRIELASKEEAKETIAMLEGPKVWDDDTEVIEELEAA